MARPRRSAAMHHGKTRAMGWAITALGGSIFLTACGADQPAPAGDGQNTPSDERSGTLTLKLSGAANVAGFLLEVKDANGYNVSSTPMLSASEPEPDCKTASHKVTIRAGKTSELTLLSQCQSPSAGGLD